MRPEAWWTAEIVLLSVAISLATPSPGSAAPDESFTVLTSPGAAPSPEVAFLERPPRIDGELDEALRELPERGFRYLIRTAAEEVGHRPSYRMAYGTDFFYLFVTLEAEELLVRDRAYQNGDGFVVVFGPGVSTREDADEYHVLGFAPAGGPFGVWKFTWSYNGEWPFLPMGDDARLEVRHAEGRLSFELLLPWRYVYPHHPWFTEPLEFNLMLTKAEGETDEHLYLVAADEANETVEFTSRIGLRFAAPSLARGAQTYAVLERNHVREGGLLRLATRTVAAGEGGDRLFVGLLTGERDLLDRRLLDLALTPGLSEGSFELPSESALPGAYLVLWRSMRHGSTGEIAWSVLSDLELETVERELAEGSGAVPAGTRATLLFEMQEIEAAAGRLLPYDTAGSLRLDLARFARRLAEVRGGGDPLAGRTGYVRRAFRSEVDGTLQPYTVRVPEDYDPAKSYPAIVFLHGSDVDDTAVRRHEYLERKGFFIIAPRGRNPQGAYILENAQDDIEEAVADALRSYAIDSDRLVLAGFSMGGYGAYRTFWERPDRYRGVAVFSGDPDLANRYLQSESYPNFLDERYLEPFAGTRVAVFHGRADRNCPFELTDEVVGKLESAGAEVIYHIDEEVGHSPPRDPEILRAFHEWLGETGAGPPL